MREFLIWQNKQRKGEGAKGHLQGLLEKSWGQFECERWGRKRTNILTVRKSLGGWWKETDPETELQGCKKWVRWKKAETGLSLDRLRWGDSVMGVGDREQEREGWGWACCQGWMKVVLSCFLRWMGKPGYIWFWWVIETEGKSWWKMREILWSLEKANSSSRCYTSGTRLTTSRYVNSWRWWWWAKIQVKIVGKAEKETSLKRQRIPRTKMELMCVWHGDWGYQQIPGEKGKERGNVRVLRTQEMIRKPESKFRMLVGVCCFCHWHSYLLSEVRMPWVCFGETTLSRCLAQLLSM